VKDASAVFGTGKLKLLQTQLNIIEKLNTSKDFRKKFRNSGNIK
jgi:hypothetical protein